MAGIFVWMTTAGIGCQTQAPVETAVIPTHEQMVERGNYLVTTFACNDCHTPFKMGPSGPEPDMTRMLSGHPEGIKLPPPPELSMDGWVSSSNATNTAFAGPWGITYSPNLTSDQNTGLGIWD